MCMGFIWLGRLRGVCEGAFAPPLVGVSFLLFSFPFLLLFLSPFPFFTLQVSSFVSVRSKIFSSAWCLRSRCQREPCGLRYTPVSSGLTRPQSGPKTVPSGILEPESRVPQAGGDWSGYLGAAKQLPPLDSALSLLFCFSPGWSPFPPMLLFFFCVLSY